MDAITFPSLSQYLQLSNINSHWMFSLIQIKEFSQEVVSKYQLKSSKAGYFL